MKIAINTLSLNRTKAGMGNYIKNLVDGLSKIDKDNEYFVIVSENNKDFFRINKKNFKIINLGKKVTMDLPRLFWEQISLPRFLKKNKIDVLHSPSFVMPIISKAKNVLTVADMTFITHPQVHTLIKRVYFSLFMPYSIKKADRVISISESTKKDILHYVKVDEKKIKTIYLAADSSFIVQNKEKCRKKIKENYDVSSPFILFIGMIEPRKNLERLIIAFSELRKKGNIPYRLVIVGRKGWKVRGMLSMIKSLEIEKEIIFTGYVPDEDLARFYNAAEFFVYPSLYEGFGIPIIEAMACGCPVITSNISSMPEVAGDAALLVDPGDVSQISSAMRRLIKDKKLREDMIKRGIKRSSEFSWKKCAKETLKIYRGIK